MSLEGRLEDMGLADIFQITSLSKRSGVLTLIRKEGTGRLVFNQGRIIFASSDTRSRLGYTLVQKGIIANDDLEYALRVQKRRGSKKPIGTILLEMKALDRETFERELRDHIISVVHDLLSWNSGSFYFELSSATDEEIASNTGFNTEFLLLEGLKLQDEEERDRGEAMPLRNAEPPERSTVPVEQGASAPAPTPSSPLHERKDLRLLIAIIPELSRPSGTNELTLMILRFAGQIMNRAVVFLVRKNDIVGLEQCGLTFPEGHEQERIRSIQIPLSEPSIFKEVAEKKMIYKGPLADNEWHRSLMNRLGEKWPEEVFVAPVVYEGRTIAVLYGDNLPENKAITETEGLEAFIKVAEVAFAKALLERKFQEMKSSGS